MKLPKPQTVAEARAQLAIRRAARSTLPAQVAVDFANAVATVTLQPWQVATVRAAVLGKLKPINLDHRGRVLQLLQQVAR